MMNRAAVLLLGAVSASTATGLLWRDYGRHDGQLVMLAIAAAVAGVLVHVVRRRAAVWPYHLALVASSLAIALEAHLYGGGVHSLADAWLLVLPVACTAFYFTGLGVAVHAAAASAALVAALAPLGTPTPDLSSMVAVLVVLAIWVRALARASEAAGLDRLTRLHDRPSTTARLSAALQQAQRGGDPVQFALLGLDGFTAVNEVRGHAAGDDLLRSAAVLWRSAIPTSAVLGRWGGDQFALVLRCSSDEAWTLLHDLRSHCPGDLSFSAGVVAVELVDDVEAVIDHAEGSLAAAKRDRRGSFHLWVSGTPTSRGLLAALHSGEVEVHYQPVISLRSGATTGAEALVRWRRPEGGFVPPADFLPHAESSGVILDLGRYVLARACADAAAWPTPRNGVPLTVAVNASGAELARPEYAAFALSVLAQAGLPADQLIIEVVEGLLDENSPAVMSNLHALRVAGVRLAVDDFGTGYSNLSRLARLPLDILKIDRSFVGQVQSAEPAPVCSGVLALAEAMQLTVVAEGVEQKHQALWLRRHGCQEAQGWLWAPALPHQAFVERLVSEHQPQAVTVS